MAVIKDLNMPEANQVTSLRREGENSDEVQKFSKHIKAITEVTEAAGKVVGIDKLEQEKRKMEEELREAQKEVEKLKMETLTKQLDEIKMALKAATEQRDVPAIKELEQKLEQVREAYHMEQLEALRRELEELRKERSQRDITEDIKRIKEVGKELGLTSSTPTTPPDIMLQLKHMDYELQLELERIRDERDRREKEWQLTLKKWEEEKELRKQEIDAKVAAERDKVDTLKTIGTRLGKAIFEGALEGSQGGIGGRPSANAKSYTVEAMNGEAGEFNCPKCSSVVGIAPDTVKAICANCGQVFPIKRTPSGQEKSSEANIEHTSPAT